MKIKNEIFEIEYMESSLIIETINLPGQALFSVKFTDGTPTLVICRATDFNQVKFWTSIPEGRQSTAEAICTLIEKHFHSKMK